MTANDYIRSRGLVPAVVSQKMGVSRQCIDQWGKTRNPTAKSIQRLAKAMTDLGVPTSIVDIVAAVYDEKLESGD